MISLRAFDILLIEDNPEDAGLFTWAVGRVRPECDVHVVPDGRAAAEYLTQRVGPGALSPLPSLIVTDLRMPGQSGHDFLSWKQARAELARVPVVVLSGSPSAGEIERSYALGARSCLAKPLSLPDFAVLAQSLVNFWGGCNLGSPWDRF
jgi:CheY-like chemotaxis protein